MNVQTQSVQKQPPAVLIVEDDMTCVYLWQRYMKRSGFRAISTQEGKEALDMARRERPDLVVLDVMLPDIDGWDVLQALKADPSTCDIPVLICSALREEKRGMASGADGYLQKPILYEDFLAALSRMHVEPEPHER
jgi:DNA-binding response OmpR family regulator